MYAVRSHVPEIIKQGRHKRHTRSHSNDTKLLFSFQTTSHKTKPYPVYTYVAILTNQTSFILNANIIINVQTPDITPNTYQTSSMSIPN